MSSVASPFGLRPAMHPSGYIRQSQGTIASGYNTSIYQFSPVTIAAAGVLQAAAPGTRIVGVFLGVEWTATDGRRRVGNRWEADTVGTEIVAYYSSDPEMIYEIQANGSVALADLGEQMDWTALAGNDITGLSSVALDTASSAANAGLRILNLNPGPDNEWGDSYTVVQVNIAEHQFKADVAAI